MPLRLDYIYPSFGYFYRPVAALVDESAVCVVHFYCHVGICPAVYSYMPVSSMETETPGFTSVASRPVNSVSSMCWKFCQ